MPSSSTAAANPKTKTLSPIELASLLGIEPADAGFLTTVDLKVPAAWVKDWQSRAMKELCARDLSIILGRPVKTIYYWLAGREGRPPILHARRSGPRNYRISPAQLIADLEAMAGNAPSIARAS